MKTGAKFRNFVVVCLVLFVALVPAQASKAQRMSKKIKIVEYCSIAQSPQRYAGKVIRTRALMTFSTVSRVDDGDSFLYSWRCNKGDYFAIPNFSEQKIQDKSSQFFEKLSKETDFIFEVVIIGEFVNSIIPKFGHLSWAINEFKVHEISSIRDVTSRESYKKPNFDADSPRTDAGEHLRWLNCKILFYFLGNPTERIDKYFDDHLVIIDASGRSFPRNEINEFINGTIFDAIPTVEEKFVKDPFTSYKGGKYVASGEAGITLNSGEKKTIHYECIYRPSKYEFILEKITFSYER